MRNTAYLILTLLIFTLASAPSRSAGTPQSKDSVAPPRRELGSSLKNLEWDPQKRMAVEKQPASGLEPGKVKSEGPIKLETTLVTFPVSVTAPNGRPVTGLDKDDFVLVED